MSDQPTPADLRRERDDLMRAIAEDKDRHGRDHWPNGRWPIVHELSRWIDEMERNADAD